MCVCGCWGLEYLCTRSGGIRYIMVLRENCTSFRRFSLLFCPPPPPHVTGPPFSGVASAGRVRRGRVLPSHTVDAMEDERRADGESLFWRPFYDEKVLTKACKSVTTGPYSLYAPPCDPYPPFAALPSVCSPASPLPRRSAVFRFDTFSAFLPPFFFFAFHFWNLSALWLPVRNNGHFISTEL